MTTERATGTNWGRRAVWAGAGLVLLALAVLVTSATVPRWWAHRVGDQVDGSITQGTTLGIVYGFVFTFLPIVTIVLLLRWRRSWKTIAVALAIGIVLALPNLMTLSIVIGRGNAAHAGDRILDVEAPAFRGGTLAGAIVAGLLIVFGTYLLVSRDRAQTNARRARAERQETATPPSDAPPPTT